jgi:hypothetical protein
MATPYHVTSTDRNPQHHFCPENSWCWYKNEESEQKSHEPYLLEELLPVILPVYERLSDEKLLERCERVATQNANECVNGQIWLRCPKTLWMGRKSIMIGAVMGVLVFNGGAGELVRVQSKFGLCLGEKTAEHAKRKDDRRLSRKVESGVVRKSRQHRIVTERERQIQKEGVTYAAGKFV